MKKTDIIPEIELMAVNGATFLAESLGVDGDKTVSGGNGGWVKSNDASSRSDYNVWNEDWSK